MVKAGRHVYVHFPRSKAYSAPRERAAFWSTSSLAVILGAEVAAGVAARCVGRDPLQAAPAQAPTLGELQEQPLQRGAGDVQLRAPAGALGGLAHFHATMVRFAAVRAAGGPRRGSRGRRRNGFGHGCILPCAPLMGIAKGRYFSLVEKGFDRFAGTV